MIWSATGNKWLDKWVNHAYNFTSELDTAACHSSPLTSSERADIRKCMQKLNDINQQVAERVRKK